MRYTIVQPPTEEPVTLEELKSQCRVCHDREDSLLLALGRAAREMVEVETARCIITQTVKVRLDYFDRYSIRLPLATAQSIEEIWYKNKPLDYDKDRDPNDKTGWTQLEKFQFSPGEPGVIRPSFGAFFPFTTSLTDDVEITYTCGYGSKEAVPDSIKAAILMQAAHLYEHREATISGTIVAEVPLGVQRLIDLNCWQGFGGAT